MKQVNLHTEEAVLKIIKKKVAAEKIEQSSNLLEYLILGFEQKLKQLYEEFQRGESSLGYLADQLGISPWEAVELLEKRDLRTTNL